MKIEYFGSAEAKIISITIHFCHQQCSTTLNILATLVNRPNNCKRALNKMTPSNAETYFIYHQNVMTLNSCKIDPHSKRMFGLENATDELMLSLQTLDS